MRITLLQSICSTFCTRSCLRQSFKSEIKEKRKEIFKKRNSICVSKRYFPVLLDAIRDHVVASSLTGAGGANPLLPAVFSKEHIEIIDFHPLEIARQMTLYSFGLFCAIEPSEILQQRWNSAEKEVRGLVVL